MKKLTTILFIILLQTATLFANNENDTLSKQKQCFYDAKTELENMLSSKIPLDYERAVFITENAYWNNKYDFERFKKVIDIHVYNIQKIAEINKNEKSQDFKSTLLVSEEQKRKSYCELLNNWAIFSYLTDTTIFNNSSSSYYHFPYKYSHNDPFGSLDWSNSQVLNLFLNKSANCYALTSFYKILSERLQSNANIGLAPGHVYIIHKDIKGIQYNIEIPSRSFPGAGSIMTLTYTPVDAVRNGIAMRTLDIKQSVALCLIYLGKGYEHKFDTKTDYFIQECAESALKYDTASLNAMLLNVGVLEERILKKNKSITQLQTDDEFIQYQKLLVTLYEKGYREMPLDMKNLIISHLQQDSAIFILTDHTPKGFQTINPKDDRYATLSMGMFDEVHEPKLIEQYGRTILNTKTKKITNFVEADSLYNKYPIDPVVSAWSVDPMSHRMPAQSPYSAFMNNPIFWDDPGGDCPICPWLDAIVDIAFAAYDVSEIAYDYFTTGQVNPVSVAALTADLGAIFIPMTTGAGLAVRAASTTTKGAVKTTTKIMVAKAKNIVIKNADDINKTFTKIPGRYAPYKAGTKVAEFTTETTEQFVRVYKEGSKSKASGPWMMKKSDLLDESGKMLSPKQIQQKFSLEHTPDRIVDVNVPANTNMRMGEAAPVEQLGTAGGGTQFQLLQDIPTESYTNIQVLK